MEENGIVQLEEEKTKGYSNANLSLGVYNADDTN